jgi:hypothetical protein
MYLQIGMIDTIKHKFIQFLKPKQNDTLHRGFSHEDTEPIEL